MTGANIWKTPFVQCVGGVYSPFAQIATHNQRCKGIIPHNGCHPADFNAKCIKTASQRKSNLKTCEIFSRQRAFAAALAA
jgi:hypothetical protein